MSREVICADCGRSFQEDGRWVGGSYWCPSCRPKHQKAISKANEESYQQFRRIHHNNCPDEADRKAREVAAEVEKERAKKGRHYRNSR